MLVRSCVACVVWGFVGILVGRHFYCRAVRCLRRGSGALRAETGSVTCLVAPLKTSGTRGFGCAETLRREPGCAADYLPGWTRSLLPACREGLSRVITGWPGLPAGQMPAENDGEMGWRAEAEPGPGHARRHRGPRLSIWPLYADTAITFSNRRDPACAKDPPLCSAAALAMLPDDYVQNWPIRRAANSAATPGGRTCRRRCRSVRCGISPEEGGGGHVRRQRFGGA